MRAHHEHVAQRGGLRVGRVGGVEQAEVLLRGVGQQVEEGGAGLVLGIDLFGLLHHLERLVIAAGGHAGRAALAEIADEDGEDAAGAGSLALRRGEDGVDLLIGHRHLVDDVVELRLGFGGEAVDADSVTSRMIVGSGVPVLISASMRGAGLLLDLGQACRASWRARRGRPT